MSKIGLIGKKLGMTRVYDDKGRSIPVTVIAAAGNKVLQVKTPEKDGYTAVQLGFDDQKPQRVTKPLLGHFARSSAPAKKVVREFRVDAGESVEVGQDVPVTHFVTGQFVDIIGQSKGKGFQGVMRKHNFGGQPASHGSTMHRRNGAIGNRSTPGRVWKNMGMPGHLGDDRVTVQNLRIVQVREADGVLLVSGPVPGAKGGYLLVRPSKKKPAPAK